MTGQKNLFAFAAVLLVGCGTESGDLSMVADSAGVLIVSNQATESSALPQWTLQEEPAVLLGTRRRPGRMNSTASTMPGHFRMAVSQSPWASLKSGSSPAMEATS